jgi:hypothetical protein
MYETIAEAPRLPGISQTRQQIGYLFGLGAQLRAIAIAGLAHSEDTTCKKLRWPHVATQHLRHSILDHLAALRPPAIPT